jgi:hypothetical protein
MDFRGTSAMTRETPTPADRPAAWAIALLVVSSALAIAAVALLSTGYGL